MQGKAIYRVRGADTLWGIARDHLGDPNKYRDIKEWNNLPGFDIRPGMILKLYDPSKEEKENDNIADH